MKKPRFSSRKLLISSMSTIIACALPIIYKHLGISDVVTMSVLGLISAMALGYSGFNILEKKIAPDDK